jgi:hypothetical protein
MVRREKARALDPERSAQQALQKLSFCAYVWFARQKRPFTVFFNWNFWLELEISRSKSGILGS